MNKYNQKHLTLDNRSSIQLLLDNGMNFKEIGKFLSKDPTTISKEIKNHRIKQIPSSFNGGSVRCEKLKSCDNKSGNFFITCNEKCPDFIPIMCKKLSKPPFVCNPCTSKQGCRFIKYYYRSKEAFQDYKETLSLNRTGIALGKEAFYQLDDLISPLVKKGQTLGHICHSNKDSINISRRTIYNYFENGYLSVSNIDLPRKVRYKPRKKSKAPQIDKKVKEGRNYLAFLNFCNQNAIDSYVEMDTVISSGCKVLLTLLFTNSNFMIARLLDDKTSQSIIQSFYHIRRQLVNKIEFSKLFNIILTDNGTEFSDPLSLECDEQGEITTKVFYCDPYSSYQKPHIEKNHEYIRYILPKGYSFDKLTQSDVNLALSHINGVKRDSLNGKSPYEMFSFIYGKHIAKALDITEIKANDIILKPTLLSR